MPASTYREFLQCIRVTAVSMRFREQALEGEDGVTGQDDRSCGPHVTRPAQPHVIDRLEALEPLETLEPIETLERADGSQPRLERLERLEALEALETLEPVDII